MQVQHAKVILRNLPERRIGRAEDHEDFRQRRERDVGATVFAGNRDGAKPALRPEIELRPRQQALAVALGRARSKLGRECMRTDQHTQATPTTELELAYEDFRFARLRRPELFNLPRAQVFLEQKAWRLSLAEIVRRKQRIATGLV